MTYLLIAITLLAHLILPAFFIYWTWRMRPENKLLWLSVVLLLGSYLIFIAKAGAGWSWFGGYWRTPLVAFFVAAAARGLRRLQGKPWLPADRNWKSWSGLTFRYGVAIFLILGLPAAFTAAEFDASKAVALEFPLKGGTFHIGHGGSNMTMNHHNQVPAQKFALDIVQLNRFDTRAAGLLPKELSSYRIYGAELSAPCSGEIVASEDGLPDQPIMVGDKTHIAGNFLAIDCGGFTVFLAHLKPQSLKVKTGDKVEAGTALAQVGNSGNTSEPHLHLQAVVGRVTDMEALVSSGESLPMTFNGQFPVRNDRVYR